MSVTCRVQPALWKPGRFHSKRQLSTAKEQCYTALLFPRSVRSLSSMKCLAQSICFLSKHTYLTSKIMAGHNDRREDKFLQKLGLPQAYYSDDDGRRSRPSRTDDKLRERFNRDPSWARSANPHGERERERKRERRERKGGFSRRSHAREPSPPPPINQRRTIMVTEQQDNPPQLPGAPDIYLIPPSQSYDRGGRDTLARGRSASNPAAPVFAEPQPTIADPTAVFPATAAEIGRSGATRSDERIGPSTAASNLIPGFRRSLSVDESRRLSSDSGVLGDKVYLYTPLGDGELRLVSVLAARSSQVKCDILHRSFEDPPGYIALSYVWGDPSDTTKIKIRDEHFPVFVEVPISKSLYYALEALRRKGEDVLV